LFLPPLSASEVGAYLKTGRVASSTSSLANYLKDFPTQAENREARSLGYKRTAHYLEAKRLGYDSKVEYYEAKSMPPTSTPLTNSTKTKAEYDAFKASPAYNEWVAQEHTEVFLEEHRDKINANIDELQKGIDLVAVCGDMTRTKEQKKQLDVFLKHEMVLQNLPSAVERIPMLLAVKEANEKLKAACEARNEELKKVREATDAVSVYLEGAGGSAAMEVRVNQWRQERIEYCKVDVELLAEKEAVSLEVENLSQIHFTPPGLTKFAFHAPYCYGENVTEEMMTMVEAAIQVAGYQGDTVALAGGGDPTIQEKDHYGDPIVANKHKCKLFMEAPVELLVTYAETKINEAFVKLMVHLFGDMDVEGSGGRFKQAPVKTKKRIMSKIKEDLKEKDHDLWAKLNYVEEDAKKEYYEEKEEKGEDPDPEEAEAAGQEAWNELALRYPVLDRMTLATLGYGINDVVRGAVKCDGEHGMLQDLETMKSNPTLGPIRFRTKRIKNTHHLDASTVGGYRDVKVIGELTIGESDSMLVEVQLIDRVFLDIKKFMHRPYSVGRGDFGSMPLLGRVCQGSEGEMKEQKDLVTAVVAEGATEIGNEAFDGCSSLMEVKLPGTVEVIGEGAFFGCSSLRGELTLPDSLKRIEGGAFYECSKLESIHFPAASSLLEFVHEEAFIGCKPSAIPSDIIKKWNLVFEEEEEDY